MGHNGMRLDAQNINTIKLGSIVHKIGRACVIILREIIFNMTSYNYCISIPILKLINGNLHNTQLQTKWDKYRNDPMVKIVCGVGSAHNNVLKQDKQLQ